VLERFQQSSDALALRAAQQFLTLAMTAPKWTNRERDTFEACTEYLSRKTLYPGPLHGVAASDEQQLEVMLAAVGTFRGTNAVRNAREELFGTLPIEGRLRAQRASYERLTRELEDVARNGIAFSVEDGSQKASANDLRELRRAVERLCEITKRGVLGSDVARQLERGMRSLDDAIDRIDLGSVKRR
jgi:hypothetical protein